MNTKLKLIMLSVVLQAPLCIQAQQPMPPREWGTYYGGEKADEGYSVVVDPRDDSVYLGGSTYSLNGIAQIGFQNSIGGDRDAFLAKFAPSGSRIWATYYGGSSFDACSSIAVDPQNGWIYVAGLTASTNNIATAGGYQESIGGRMDACLVKFDSTGTRLWGTYFGGEESEEGVLLGLDGPSVAVSTDQHVYLAGSTLSVSNIASNGVHQTSLLGSFDAYLVKFDSAGNRIWSTYYGGEGRDLGLDVAASLDVYLAGITESASSIASGGFKNSITGNWDAFLVKFNSNGVRQWATYYGGLNFDQAYSVAISPKDNSVYLAGVTNSFDSISTPGVHQFFSNGSNEAFLVKFNSNGDRLWATYYGGDFEDQGYSITVDANGFVYMAGLTLSSNAIASSVGVHQSRYGGNVDAFLVKFNTHGIREWGTYYGGQDFDAGYSVAVGQFDRSIYLAGMTSSTSAISEAGHQNIYGGGAYDAFLVKFRDRNFPCDYFKDLGSSYGYRVVNNQTLGIIQCNVSEGVSPYRVQVGNRTFTESLNYTFINDLPIGNYTIVITDGNGCRVEIPFNVPDLCSGFLASVVEVQSELGSNNQTVGRAKIKVTGGEKPYRFISNNFFPIEEGGGIYVIEGLRVGNYRVKIRDRNGCETQVEFTVKDLCDEFSAEIDLVSEIIDGLSLGKLQVRPIRGRAPYRVQVNGQQEQEGAGPFEYAGLRPGVYEVKIRDAQGCEYRERVEITDECRGLSANVEPISEVADGVGIGRIRMSVSGGNAPYRVVISGQQEQEGAGPFEYAGLRPGAYEVIVKDAKGCVWKQNVQINNLCDGLRIGVMVQEDVVNNQPLGNIYVNVLGGTAPYRVSIDGQSDQSGDGPFNFRGVGVGIYEVKLKDANGCEVKERVEVKNICAGLGANVRSTYYIERGKSLGEVVVIPQGGLGPYTVQVGNLPPKRAQGGIPTNFRGLSAGEHVVTVTDRKGCQYTAKVTVRNGCPELTTSVRTEVNEEGDLSGVVTVNVNGGMPTYTLILIEEGGNEVQRKTGSVNQYVFRWDRDVLIRPGRYVVVVRDVQGCESRVNITVKDRVGGGKMYRDDLENKEREQQLKNWKVTKEMKQKILSSEREKKAFSKKRNRND